MPGNHVLADVDEGAGYLWPVLNGAMLAFPLGWEGHANSRCAMASAAVRVPNATLRALLQQLTTLGSRALCTTYDP